jgi:signal transduction histidine kinase
MTSIESKNITVVSHIPESLILHIDSGPLIICFSNILSNAIKYSAENEKIEIHLSKESFSVKDYGVGIKKENLKKIFERDYREEDNEQ